MFDLIIRGGKIIDGTGSPYYYGDIGISDGKIKKIGKHLSSSEKVIDADGLHRPASEERRPFDLL